VEKTKHILKMTQRQKRANEILYGFIKTLSAIKFNDNFESAITNILNCKGKIVVSGMGKAGTAMRKFSSLLCSFGVPSCYIHPGEAMHGDIGVIEKKDIVFVASTSGKTREVLDFINLVKKLNVNCIIGITSHPDSEIRELVDIVIDMGLIKEEGKLAIAPTSSILAMLAITDAIALIIAEEKNLTLEEYSKYHHSGYLGQKSRGDNVIY
jgi:arabinose-5-phosphate isomerase